MALFECRLNAGVSSPTDLRILEAEAVLTQLLD